MISSLSLRSQIMVIRQGNVKSGQYEEYKKCKDVIQKNVVSGTKKCGYSFELKGKSYPLMMIGFC